MYYKPDWPKVRERFQALWNNEVLDRCCVSVVAPRRDCPLPPNMVSKSLLESMRLTQRYWNDPERILEELEKTLSLVYFGGEALPNLMMNFGASGHAAYFGGRYVIDERTLWFEPSLTSWDDPLKFDSHCEMLQVQLNCAKYLAAAGRDRFFVSSLDNAGHLDTLAHLRGNEQALMDLILEEQKVMATLQAIVEGWSQVNDQMYAITKECNDQGSMIGWLHMWAEGNLSQLQADISVMLSNEMFRKYIMYELEETISRLDYSLYHFDGKDQLRHLDDLLSLERLGMIQWTSVVNQESYLTFIPVFQRIQAAGKGLLINQVRIQDVEELLRALSPEGLFIQTEASSQDEAELLLKNVASWSRQS